MWLNKTAVDVDLSEPSPYKEGDILLMEPGGNGLSVVKVVDYQKTSEQHRNENRDVDFEPEFDVACETLAYYPLHPVDRNDEVGNFHTMYWRNLYRNIREMIEADIRKGYLYPDVILRRYTAPDVDELASDYPQLIGYENITDYIPTQILSVENLYALVLKHYKDNYWYWYIPELDLRSIDQEMFHSLRMFNTPEEAVNDLREWVSKAGPQKEFPQLAENVVKAFELLTPHASGPYFKGHSRTTHSFLHMIFLNNKTDRLDKYYNITIVFDAQLSDTVVNCKVSVYQGIPDRPSVSMVGTPMFNMREDKFRVQVSEMKKLPYLLITKAYGLINSLGEGGNDDNFEPEVPSPPMPTIESPDPELVNAQNHRVVKISSIHSLSDALNYKTKLMEGSRWFSATYWKSDVLKSAINLLYMSYKNYFQQKFGISWLEAKRKMNLITHDHDEAISIIRRLDNRNLEEDAERLCVVGIGPYRAYSPSNWTASNGVKVLADPNGWNGSIHAAQYEEENVFAVACDIDVEKAKQALKEYEDNNLVDVMTEKWNLRNLVREGD